MDIVVYRSQSPWATPNEDAFAEGLRVHGIEPEFRHTGNIRASDLAVIWAHRHKALFQTQRQAGAHYLVMERGYVGDIHARRKWTSLGFDGLNGRAVFAKDMPSDRWERNFPRTMKPWQDGRYAVVMGQVRGDASIEGVNITTWYEEAAANLKADWGIPVKFRPHPNDAGVFVPYGCEVDTGSLEDCLSGASVVATFNSTSGVQSVLSGVPTIARDRGSMAWAVSARDYDHRFTPDRDQWAADLAYTSWTVEEMASGLAWNHLRDLI
jgi:hypothetical protein